jgi:hypothetical protein
VAAFVRIDSRHQPRQIPKLTTHAEWRLGLTPKVLGRRWQKSTRKATRGTIKFNRKMPFVYPGYKPNS